MRTETGVPASRLNDADLARELTHLYATRMDTVIDGSADALQAHTERMLELEQAYLERYPERTKPNPLRTRAGSRHIAEANGTQPPPR